MKMEISKQQQLQQNSTAMTRLQFGLKRNMANSWLSIVAVVVGLAIRGVILAIVQFSMMKRNKC